MSGICSISSSEVKNRASLLKKEITIASLTKLSIPETVTKFLGKLSEEGLNSSDSSAIILELYSLFGANIKFNKDIASAAKSYLESNGITDNAELAATNAATETNRLKVSALPFASDFLSQSVKQIFATTPVTLKMFESKINADIFSLIYLDKKHGKFILSSSDVNNNIKRYLEELFKILISWVNEGRSTKFTNTTLFKKNTFNSQYAQIIAAALEKFQSLSLSLVNSASDKQNLIKAFSLLSLVKFDEILKENFGNLVGIDVKFDGFLTLNDKYTILENPLKMGIFFKDGDETELISSNVLSNFFKMWVSTIPLRKSSTKEIIFGEYCDPNQVQILFAKLAKTFLQYYMKTGRVLDFTHNPEETLKLIFTDPFFADSINDSNELYSIKYYFMESHIENDLTSEYSISEMLDSYRASTKDSSRYKELNLFNILGFEVAKANLPTIVMMSKTGKKINHKVLNLFDTGKLKKSEKHLVNKIIQEIRQVAADPNYSGFFSDYYYVKNGNKYNLLEAIKSNQLNYTVNLLLSREGEDSHITLYTLINQFTGININKHKELFNSLTNPSHARLNSIINTALSTIANLPSSLSDKTIDELTNDELIELVKNQVNGNALLNLSEDLSAETDVEIEMTTLNGNKDAIAVVRTYCPMFDTLGFISNFNEVRGKTFKNPSGACLFTKFPQLFTNNNNLNYKSNIAAKIDVKTKTGYKKFLELTPKESLYYELMYGFIDSYLKNGTIMILPTAYSDKASIYDIIVNMNAFINLKDGRTFKDLSLEELINYYYSTQREFYKHESDKLIDKWEKIFTEINKLSGREYKTSFSSVDEINEQLAILSSLPEYDYDFNKLDDLIYDACYNIWIKDLSFELVADKDLCWYKAVAKDGKSKKLPQLNHSLVTEIKNISSFQTFKKSILKQYLSFLKFTDENFKELYIPETSDILETLFVEDDNISYLQKDLSEEEQTDLMRKSVKNYTYEFKLGADKSETVNAILFKFLILHNMFSDSFLGMSVGQPWIHKSKYIHSVIDKDGNRIEGLPLKGTTLIFTLDDIDRENSSRSNTFIKRMNSLTASSEKYVTSTTNSIPIEIEAAIIEDHYSKVFNFDGKYDDGLESTNGLIMAAGWSAIQMELSMPARGIRGILKNIFLHVGDGFSMLIKDALQPITNLLIRDTAYSESKKIDYKILLQKMCNRQNFLSVDITHGKTQDASQLINEPLYYNHLGKYYKLTKISATLEENGSYTYTFDCYLVDQYGKAIKVEIDGKELVQVISVKRQIKTVYDLWNALGGEDSMSLVNGKLLYSEASMKATAAFMTIHPELNNNLIHILAFISAVKNGAVNVNKASKALYNDSEQELLMSVKIKMSMTGIQNDKNHIVDEDSIREMSLVMSAAAANPLTKDLAAEIYNEIAEIVEETLDDYKKFNFHDILTDSEKKELYKTLSDEIIDAFAHAKHISGAHGIIEILKSRPELFLSSDSQLYHKFVSSLLSKLNKYAIKRKWKGLAGILASSDGAIQVLLDENGIVHLMSDIRKEALKPENANLILVALKEANPDRDIKNVDIIRQYIADHFKDLDVKNNYDLRLGDVVYITDGKVELGESFLYKLIRLNDPLILQKYQQSSYKLRKSLKTPRDLKPCEHTWKQVIPGKKKLIEHNFWTCPSVTLNLKLSNLGKLIDDYDETDLTSSRSTDEQALEEYIKKNNLKASSFLTLITQRFTLLIENGYSIVDGKWMDAIPYLIKLDLYSKDLPEELTQALLKSGVLTTIQDYKVEEAECLLPDEYHSKFMTNGETVSSILKQGESFFKLGINELFHNTTPNSDFSIYTENETYHIAINECKATNKIDITDEVKLEVIDGKTYRVDADRHKMYEWHEGMKVYSVKNRNEYFEVLVIPSSITSNYDNLKAWFKSISNFGIINCNFDSILKVGTDDTVTFKMQKYAILNLLKVAKDRNHIYFQSFYRKYIEKLKSIESFTQLEDLVAEYKLEKDGGDEKESILIPFINRLAKEKFISFKETLHILSARIPAQTLLSFMTMKNVGFTQSELNHIYVSRWQIYILGSDFDIDVAYNLMYNIGALGTLDTYSPLANISSEELFKKSKQLPKPTKITLDSYNDVNSEGKAITYKDRLITKDLIPDITYLLIEVNDNGSVKYVITEDNELPIGNNGELVELREISGKKTAFYLIKKDINQLDPNTQLITRSQLLTQYKSKYLKHTYYNVVFKDSESPTRILELFDLWRILKDAQNEDELLLLLDIYIEALNIINNNSVIIFNKINYSEDFTVADDVEEFVLLINKHNSLNLKFLEGASKNYILDRLRGVSNALVNAQLSYSGVDDGMKPIKAEISKLGKDDILGDIHDGSFIFKMQEINYIGKKTVGIFANALKGYFALSLYYNPFYEKHPDVNPSHSEYIYKAINIPIFEKDSDGNTVLKHYIHHVTSLSNAGISNELYLLFRKLMIEFGADLTNLETWVDNNFTEHTRALRNTDIILSAFLSLATDNAKELGLAKLNAGTELAGSYAYLIIMGIPIEQATKFFTSRVIEMVVDKSKGFIFDKKQRKRGVESAISLIKKYLLSTNDLEKLDKLKLIEHRSDKLQKEYEYLLYKQSLDINENEIELLDALSAIYASAQEFRALTALLKINLGLKDKSNELINFKHNFAYFIFTRYRDFGGDSLFEFVLNVLADKPQLAHKKFSSPSDYIKDVKSGNPVSIIGKILKQCIDSLILIPDSSDLTSSTIVTYKNISFNKFFYDKKYQNAVVKFYDLIKDTFNIYDCIVKSPIYYSILKKTAFIDTILLKASLKHKESSTIYERIFKLTTRLPENAFYEKSSTLIPISVDQITAVLNLVEHKIITEWFKSEYLKKFVFNLADIKGKTKGLWRNKLIDLTTEEGILEFKSLMETIIIPEMLLKDDQFTGNEFVERLVMYQDPYTNAAWYKLDANLSKMADGNAQELLEALQLGYEEVRKVKAPITDITGLETFTYGDLLFIYSMIANKNKYGPQRMTAIFEKLYADPDDKLVLDYLTFSSNLEKDGNLVITDEEFLFALYQQDGKLTLPTNNGKTNLLGSHDAEFDGNDAESLIDTATDTSNEDNKDSDDKTEDKKIPKTSIFIKSLDIANGFLNMFETYTSAEYNSIVSVKTEDLKQKLLNYILNNAISIYLNCV